MSLSISLSNSVRRNMNFNPINKDRIRNNNMKNR